MTSKSLTRVCSAAASAGTSGAASAGRWSGRSGAPPARARRAAAWRPCGRHGRAGALPRWGVMGGSSRLRGCAMPGWRRPPSPRKAVAAGESSGGLRVRFGRIPDLPALHDPVLRALRRCGERLDHSRTVHRRKSFDTALCFADFHPVPRPRDRRIRRNPPSYRSAVRHTDDPPTARPIRSCPCVCRRSATFRLSERHLHARFCRGRIEPFPAPHEPNET